MLHDHHHQSHNQPKKPNIHLCKILFSFHQLSVLLDFVMAERYDGRYSYITTKNWLMRLVSLVGVLSLSIIIVTNVMLADVAHGLDDDVRAALERAQQFETAPVDVGGAQHSGGGGGGGGGADGSRHIWSEVVSWSPRLWHLHNVLWPEEMEHLMELGRQDLERSTVVGEQGASVESSVRTSKGTFIGRLADPIVKRIEERISRLTMVPVENGEDIQLLEYELGQEYKRHPDYFDAQYTDSYNGDQRHVTVLMYLTNVTEGGETIFPHGKWATDELREKYEAPQERGYTNAHGDVVSMCASRDNEGIYVKPQAGDAVMFYGLTPDNLEDINSLHASCPVLSGIKWSATIWMHVNPFRLDMYAMQQKAYLRALENQVSNIIEEKGLDEGGGACADHSDQCKDWVLAGDCVMHDDLRKIVCCSSCSTALALNAEISDVKLRDALEKGAARR